MDETDCARFSASSEDDDNDTEDEEECEDVGASCSSDDSRRVKRDIAWCDVDTEEENAGTHFAFPIQDNPAYGNKLQLFSRTNHFLAIDADGKLKGTEDSSDPHTRLELVSAGRPGHVRIRGLLTNMYVRTNLRGRMFSTYDYTNDNTIFVEELRGSYFVYRSRRSENEGYLAIKKNGKLKNGKKTNVKQKACQFLKIRRERSH